MSIAELVPAWPGLPQPSGRNLGGKSLKERVYRLRSSYSDLSLDSVLQSRGVIDKEGFSNPSLSSLPDPSSLKDMDEAAVRFAQAVENKEKVLVFGDYDVDGACSSAIIVRFAKMLGFDIDYYIPDRMKEGYGPSEAAFKNSSIHDYDLVIFVDCGTASPDLISSLSSDVIIIDHHQPLDLLPSVVACVNPHRKDDQSGLGMLCAAGVCFMFAVAVRRTLRARGFFKNNSIPDVRKLLDLAALATVADVVPLVGVSRLLVANGLKTMSDDPCEGMSALMSVSGVKEPTAGRIGFALGPRINAGGRVGMGSTSEEGALGARLLICDDHKEAVELATRLDVMNGERQQVQESALEQAMEQAENQIENGARIICVWGSSWHAGVVGIVAGRVRERFNCPAIVGSESEGIIKASGRSVPGFDLGALIAESRATGKLIAGGGHAMACGLSCEKSKWDDLRAFLDKHAIWEAQPLVVDCMADARKIKLDDISNLDRIQPTGQGNPSVVSLFYNFHVSRVLGFGKNHVRLLNDRSDMEAIFWRAGEDGFDEKLNSLIGNTIGLIGSAGINEWNGISKISITAEDVLLAN